MRCGPARLTPEGVGRFCFSFLLFFEIQKCVPESHFKSLSEQGSHFAHSSRSQDKVVCPSGGQVLPAAPLLACISPRLLLWPGSASCCDGVLQTGDVEEHEHKHGQARDLDSAHPRSKADRIYVPYGLNVVPCGLLFFI